MNTEKRIKELLKILNVPEGAEISGEQAESGAIHIVLNGEYFDTYDTVEDKLTDGNLKYARQEIEPEKYITAIISNSEFTRGKATEYFGAGITLPVLENELADAYQRARATAENAVVTWVDLFELSYDENSEYIKNTSLEELNFLAARLHILSPKELVAFKACIVGDEGMSAADMINLTYNLNNYESYADADSYEKLGRIFTQNGYVPELENLSASVLEYIDYSKIGRKVHEGKQGMFADDGYAYKISDNFRTVYDGKTFPEHIEKDTYLFRVKIGQYPKDMSEMPLGLWISLPMKNEKLSDIKKALGVHKWEECVLRGVQSIIPNMQYSIESVCEIESLNRLAQKILKLNDEQQATYKAILEVTGCKTVSKAERLIDRCNDFELHRENISFEDFAERSLTDDEKVHLPENLKKYFDFEQYMKDVLGGMRIHKTEYGILEQVNDNFDAEFYAESEENEV